MYKCLIGGEIDLPLKKGQARPDSKTMLAGHDVTKLVAKLDEKTREFLLSENRIEDVDEAIANLEAENTVMKKKLAEQKKARKAQKEARKASEKERAEATKEANDKAASDAAKKAKADEDAKPKSKGAAK
jgi:hypothetical protein